MDCRTHAGIPAVDRCAGCAEPFCGQCLVDVRGRRYCASCKVMAASQQPGGFAAAPKIPCKEADDALKYAIIGIICFGIILGPIAIVKASKAKQLMAANPNLAGGGKATAALVIGIIVTVLNIVGIIARIATLPR